ncbi:MAG: hypothetical protein U5L09_18340 [Bacteroidales bacterium]|nr:hypothetical protein [Bacteroidales bacterium]
MKKTGLVISLSLLFFAALAQEHQEQGVKEQYYNKIGFSALPFVTGTFQLQYEHWACVGKQPVAGSVGY